MAYPVPQILSNMRDAAASGAGRISGRKTVITLGEIIGPVDPRRVATGHYNVRLLGHIGTVLHDVKLAVDEVYANGATRLVNLAVGMRVLVMFASDTLQPYIIATVPTSEGAENCRHKPDQKTPINNYVFGLGGVYNRTVQEQMCKVSGQIYPIQRRQDENGLNPNTPVGTEMQGSFQFVSTVDGSRYTYIAGDEYFVRAGRVYNYIPGQEHPVPVDTQKWLETVQRATDHLVAGIEAGRNVKNVNTGSRTGEFRNQPDPKTQHQQDAMVVVEKQSLYQQEIQRALQEWERYHNPLRQMARQIMQQWGYTGEFGVEKVEQKQPGNEERPQSASRPVPQAKWKEGGLIESILQQAFQPPIVNSKELNSGGGGSPATQTGPARTQTVPTLPKVKPWQDELKRELEQRGITQYDPVLEAQLLTLAVLFHRFHVPWPLRTAAVFYQLTQNRRNLVTVLDLFISLVHLEVSLACAGLKLWLYPGSLEDTLNDISTIWQRQRGTRPPSYVLALLTGVAQGNQADWEALCRLCGVPTPDLRQITQGEAQAVGEWLQNKGEDFRRLGSDIQDRDSLDLILTLLAYGEGIPWSSAQGLRQDLYNWLQHHLKGYLWL